jgi:hypothetical protein
LQLFENTAKYVRIGRESHVQTKFSTAHLANWRYLRNSYMYACN